MTDLRARYGYPLNAPGRDLRFDFMRGFAMLSVVAAHFEAFSWFNFIFWERLGIISAAELFVIASGLVLGQVNRRTIEKDGLEGAAIKLLGRAFILYRAQVAMILIVMLVARLHVFDMEAVTSFTDRFANISYRLIPREDGPWMYQLGSVILLRISPHQIQILSLYVLLLAFSPVALWLLRHRMLGLYFTISWALYFAGKLSPTDTLVFGMQFEYAFPILIWQVMFTHALAVGFFKAEIAAWLDKGKTREVVLIVSCVLAFGFFLFAQATPNPSFPAWSRLDLMSGDRFQAIYNANFIKKSPGLPRLMNVAVFFICLYAALTYFWQPIARALGWLLIPLGESSLYVFIVHFFLIAILDQLPGYFDGIPSFDAVWPAKIWVNTLVYMGTIGTLWYMVRHRVLFGIIPR